MELGTSRKKLVEGDHGTARHDFWRTPWGGAGERGVGVWRKGLGVWGVRGIWGVRGLGVGDLGVGRGGGVVMLSLINKLGHQSGQNPVLVGMPFCRTPPLSKGQGRANNEGSTLRKLPFKELPFWFHLNLHREGPFNTAPPSGRTPSPPSWVHIPPHVSSAPLTFGSNIVLQVSMGLADPS